MKPFQDITDPNVAKALAHPLRSQILAALEQRTASPSQLATELDVPLGVLSYHVRRLTALGFLKLVKRVPRRGAVEHYYTAVIQPRISDSAWGAMPATVKEAMLSASLASLGVELGQAASAGGFDGEQSRLSREGFRLDATGFAEAASALEACARRLEEIERESDARRDTDAQRESDAWRDGDARPAPGAADPGAPSAVAGELAAPATVVMMLFRAPADTPPAT